MLILFTIFAAQSAPDQDSQGGEAKIMSGFGNSDNCFIRLRLVKDKSILW
ncbi:hypothetical protein [Mycoplasmopsis alligatoris]|nr:hypothetical protein [Mycoplasmopsis alligatoris]